MRSSSIPATTPQVCTRSTPPIICLSSDPGRRAPAIRARRLDVPINRVTQILNGRRAITGDTALRLAHFFGTSPEFWLNLQSLYEIRLAQQKAGRSIEVLPQLNRLDSIPV